jgi:hypothetical protein
MPDCLDAPSQGEFSAIQLAVGIIQHDIANQSKISDKLAEAVEKIQAMNANLIKMIALHELKHENTEDDIKELGKRLDAQLVTHTTTTSTSMTTEQLNKWKYMIIGGAFVIGWAIAHLKWSVLLTLFGP